MAYARNSFLAVAGSLLQEHRDSVCALARQNQRLNNQNILTKCPSAPITEMSL
jgi:hypothetical protein